ncbi:hypothetical protein L1987_21937 [Smallanthus sonchifolius]|uniref:Uncharacterized protein n=1 Tax=Smallanthus sonchifolius TaxID=185202 RepID=A0ACB9IE36_9ASTR|nr:hypothetical protein L1987_21937 [Smallanthus sonchifolius]
MHKQSISVLKGAAILVSLVVLLTMVEPCSASHGTMNMNQPSLKGLTVLLQSLGHTHSPPPGNPSTETGNIGRNRRLYWATVTTPSPPPPSSLFPVETATNRKLMMDGSHGARGDKLI